MDGRCEIVVAILGGCHSVVATIKGNHQGLPKQNNPFN